MFYNVWIIKMLWIYLLWLVLCGNILGAHWKIASKNKEWDKINRSQTKLIIRTAQWLARIIKNKMKNLRIITETHRKTNIISYIRDRDW